MADITLTIGNSYSQIRGLTSTQHAELRKLLCYRESESKAYHAGRPFRKTTYLIDRKGNFPTGLLSKVFQYCYRSSLRFTEVGQREEPTWDLWKDYPKWGNEPYNAQTDALTSVKRCSRGTLCLPTGTGKSRIIAMVIALRRVRTLVVVPTLELKRQLDTTLNEVFPNLPEGYVVVEHIGATRLKELNNFDCLIIDECHHSAAKTYQDLNKTAWKGIYYRYCFTATPFRSQDEENIVMQAITGDVIYELKYADAVNAGYIVPIEAYYYEVPKRRVKGSRWSQVYNELVVNRLDRNELITQCINQLVGRDKSVLCLVKEIEHGNSLSQLLGLSELFANGENTDWCTALIQAFADSRLRGLIATTGVCGEGIDTKPCEYVIIAGLGKSRNQFMQSCGRAVRKYPGKESAKVIIFLDKSHKWTKAHFAEQCRILETEYGVKPVKLN